MLHRIRLAMKSPEGFNLLGGEGTEVEVDESYVGGKQKNMHKARRAKFGGGVTGKAIVQGMLDRSLREVRATVVPDAKRETLQNLVLKNIRHGSTIYSDEVVAYDKLKDNFVHDVVNHSEQYVRGRVHTNGLENFWSLMKRGLRGTYVCVEPFHLERYVDEQVFRYNNRATKDNPLNDSDRFVLALSQIAGKRLTYKELTGKDSARPF